MKLFLMNNNLKFERFKCCSSRGIVDDDGHHDFDGQVEAVIDHYEQQNHGRAHPNRPQVRFYHFVPS